MGNQKSTERQTVEEKYGDILYQSRPVSSKHTCMSMQDRAAQFLPFAALTGYDACIRETARLTDEQIDMDENLKQKLDEKLWVLGQVCREHPEITITFFKPDGYKEGGEYCTVQGRLKRIDTCYKILVMMDDTQIDIRNVIDLQGDFLKQMEEFE